jgi:hypothetical protein
MKKIEIKDKESLIKIFRTISWLDRWRFSNENNYNFLNFSSPNLTNCEKILTHWICYITDRQMPFEIVWDKGGYIFSDIVQEYSQSNSSPKILLDDHYEKYRDKEKDKFRFRSKNVTFASRYVTDDYQNMLQTLEVLNDSRYRRNLIIYIMELIRKFKNEDDLLIRVACGLHLLTYYLKGKKASTEEVLEIIRDDRQFQKLLEQFKRTSTTGKKRLWCCIRDYKKGLYNQMFIDGIREIAPDDAEELINKWNSTPMDQIELPGDVWNNSPLFKDNLFAKSLNVESIPKTWNMPKVVRELYNQLRGDNEIKDFYPEQFDITFDFVPRMCNKELCHVCVFGRNGIDSTCIPTKNKYCPIALFSCGYIAKCTEDNCVLKANVNKGICKR